MKFLGKVGHVARNTGIMQLTLHVARNTGHVARNTGIMQLTP